jgi:hypothetical protein
MSTAAASSRAAYTRVEPILRELAALFEVLEQLATDSTVGG